jgi:hypothetical protein
MQGVVLTGTYTEKKDNPKIKYNRLQQKGTQLSYITKSTINLNASTTKSCIKNTRAD